MAKGIQNMTGDTKCGSPLTIFSFPTHFVAAPLATFCIPTHFVGDTLSGATPNGWQSLQDKILKLLSDLSGPGVHVLYRFVNSHRKASSSGPTSYETHSVAFEKQLESTGISREGDPNPEVPAPPFTMVARKRQCTHRPTITPNKTCSANLYRHIKRRVGRSLR